MNAVHGTVSKRSGPGAKQPTRTKGSDPVHSERRREVCTEYVSGTGVRTRRSHSETVETSLWMWSSNAHQSRAFDDWLSSSLIAFTATANDVHTCNSTRKSL